jgi:hypothetical protein
MPTNRRQKRHDARVQISQAAMDAWRAGDRRALHHACGLTPWEFSPLPWDLPKEHPGRDSDLCMDQSWDKVRAIQVQLYELAGEPELPPR